MDTYGFEYRKSSNRTTRLELFQRNNAIPPSAAAHGATAHALRMHRVDALRHAHAVLQLQGTQTLVEHRELGLGEHETVG